MIYLDSFSMMTKHQEEIYHPQMKRKVFTTRYPFDVFSYRELPVFEFDDITIFSGGNGSGKTTILNVIADRLRLHRGSVYNKSSFFDDYVEKCDYQLGKAIPEDSRIITSDDVFDYLLDIRNINQGVDRRRDELFEKYFKDRFTPYQLKSLDDYEELRDHADATRDKNLKHPSPYKYVADRVMRNVQEQSNGQSALQYFTSEITENALFLLDEPENSLSPEYQLELKTYIEASVRAYNCQFIISTHSPFLMSIDHAKIYDLDVTPPRERNWYELDSVKAYQRFFKDNESLF